MTDIILLGACGRMGNAVTNAAESYGCRIVAGVDIIQDKRAYPVYSSLSEVTELADAVVDFSSHTGTNSLAEFCKKTGIPAVVCCTGHTQEENNVLTELSKTAAVFQSGNMSLGIALLSKLCRIAAEFLGENADIEIIEKHHRNKIDAPSGTALMLAEKIKSVLPDYETVYDRSDRREKRPENEIGISSVRGGSIVGEHEVMFCCANETITLSHSAGDRALFANGALKAAVFMAGKQSGRYNMDDVTGEKEKTLV